jgi:hypothetical protein
MVVGGWQKMKVECGIAGMRLIEGWLAGEGFLD